MANKLFHIIYDIIKLQKKKNENWVMFLVSGSVSVCTTCCKETAADPIFSNKLGWLWKGV